MPTAKPIKANQRDGLLRALKVRFDSHVHRHEGLDWTTVQARLESNSTKLWSLQEMEQTGGEPDVVGIDKKTGECLFIDCSAQSPKGRRNASLRAQEEGAVLADGPFIARPTPRA